MQTTANGYFNTYKYQGIRDVPGAARNAIFVAGQGLETGDGAGWASPNDIPFVRAMLESLKSNYCVDENRIYSSGHSFGGYMSNNVGCNLGSTFRAIAPVMGGGPGFGPIPPGCSGKVAAWITHGRNDPTVAFSEGEASRNFWKNRNNCGDTTDDIGPGECAEYQGCDDGLPVVWCPTDLAHEPPDFAGVQIWNFFDRF